MTSHVGAAVQPLGPGTILFWVHWQGTGWELEQIDSKYNLDGMSAPQSLIRLTKTCPSYH